MSGLSTRIPQPREIWTVDDGEVKLHAESRINKNARRVFVMMNCNLVVPGNRIFNVMPLSTSSSLDLLTFPVAQGYEETVKGHLPDPKSTALINFYQPVELPFFINYRGRIDITTYDAIQLVLISEVIGHSTFDLTP